MQRDPRIFLQDVIDAANTIEIFLGEVDEASFAGDKLVQSAVYYQFAILGEALNKISMAMPDEASNIAGLRDWVNFRNILTHAYHRVTPDLVYNFAIKEVPNLKSAVQLVLKKSD